MNKISVIMNVKIKSSHDFVLENFMSLAELTRKEKGCIQYNLIQNITNSNNLIFFEIWEDKEDFSNHLKQSHIKNLISVVGKHIDVEITESKLLF